MKILKIIVVLFCVMCFSTNHSHAQSNKVALSLYKKLGYKASVNKFQEKETISLENMTHIANSYRLNADTPNAEFWYSQVVEESNNAEDFLYYAQALQSNEKYELAKEYYLKYNEKIGGENKDQRGVMLAASIDRIANFKHTSVEVANVEQMNSKKLDFSPAYYNKSVVFVSTRDEKKLKSGISDLWTDDNFMALWSAERNEDGSISTPTIFSENITSKFHEGPVCFNRAGDKVFFTRNDFNKGKRRNNSDGIMKLQIYSSMKDGDDWSRPTSLSINTKENEEAHPAISPDGKKLYFTSDRSGGFGGMDIYVSEFKGGQWSAPLNMGDKVNTKGNDVFPYVHDDGTLYFASNGWEGLGGLDIYEVKMDQNKDPMIAENIGTPFNSPKDDFSLIMNELKTEGYFTSARDGGQGKDDIYSFKTTGTMTEEATICAFEVGTDKRLENVEMAVNNTNSNNEVVTKFTNDIGIFNMTVEPNSDYTFSATKEGYEPATKTLHMTDNLRMVDEEFCIPMNPKTNTESSIVPVEKGIEITSTEIIKTTDNVAIATVPNRTTTNSTSATGSATTAVTTTTAGVIASPKSEANRVVKGAVIELPHIYYDFDKFVIRDDASNELDKIVTMMNRYPTLKIELGSHTDARGTVSYNAKLSQNRADAAVKYIVGQGISSQRLVAKGYGESQLRNDCANFIECTEEKHQYNRRTEIRVLSFDNPNTTIKYLDNSPLKIDRADPNRKWIWN